MMLDDDVVIFEDIEKVRGVIMKLLFNVCKMFFLKNMMLYFLELDLSINLYLKFESL